ncbi:MAG: ATP-dependent sacrificial sulfur transferase LarE [Gemmatimonadales bacterium]|nr:ATP-dependent sacrificial sulfur transferase LarE [Gemmatimonadales bacterium]
MRDVTSLRGHLLTLGRVVLGYSGGVDSALLAVVAAGALGKRDFLAVIGRSTSYPEDAWRAATDLAVRFGIPLRDIETLELDDVRYRANPVNRCYFCKSELWTRLDRLARDEGFDTVMDGTHADDLADHRPGLAAALERGVRSPLAELGWSKADVRRAARELEIPVWDAPAAPCLSSRIRYGLEVTPGRLRQVEMAERGLRELGFAGDLRVRHLGDTARVEVAPAELAHLEQVWDRVQAALLGLGFARVERDPVGYRRGSLLVLEPLAG